MAISTDLTLITDINSFKLGQGITFVCDVSSLISNYEEYKLYSVSNNELTELVDVSEQITAGLIVYKYYPQTSGSLNIVLCTEEVSGTIHRSNTVQLTINNNSHASNIFNANAALVANLTAMGVVGASTNDGLATNIAKVTDIPPTQRGIELDTSITCTAPASASVGVPFNITGVLTSSYDDTSATNVDMHGGELQGATVEIYNGNTLLGSCTTNIDGEYTFSYTPTATGILTIKAIYDSANDFYEDSASNSSSVSVHVAVSSVTLTTDKNILSYVDNEYATLTATVLDSNDDPIVGETVSFDIVDPDTGEVLENIDTATTDSNGECNVYYYSKGTGDLYIKCSCQNIESSNVTIGDYLYVPKLDGTESITQLSGTTTIFNNELSGGGGYLSQSWDNSIDWELTCQVKFSNNNCGLQIYPLNATDETNIMGMTASDRNTFWYNNGNFNQLVTLYQSLVANTFYDITIRKQNGVMTTIVDGTTRTFSSWDAMTSATRLHIGVGSWTGTTTIKNIKVKPL